MVEPIVVMIIVISDSLPAVGNDGNISGTLNYTCISTVEQLQAVNSNLNGSYRLIADIDLLSVDFTPLGDVTNKFDGTFDGRGFTISNLTLNLPASSDLGLFGVNSGTIEDLTLTNVDIIGDTNIGGFVGNDSNGTYSENLYCQQDSSLPAAGNNEDITGITTYDANCRIYTYKHS